MAGRAGAERRARRLSGRHPPRRPGSAAALGEVDRAGERGLAGHQPVAGALVEPLVALLEHAGRQPEARSPRTAPATPPARAARGPGRGPGGRAPPSAGPPPSSVASTGRTRPRTDPTSRPGEPSADRTRTAYVVHSPSPATTSAQLLHQRRHHPTALRRQPLAHPAGALQHEQLGGIRGGRDPHVEVGQRPRGRRDRQQVGAPGGRALEALLRAATRRSPRGRRTAAPAARRARCRRRPRRPAGCRRGTRAGRPRATPRRATRRCPRPRAAGARPPRPSRAPPPRRR